MQVNQAAAEITIPIMPTVVVDLPDDKMTAASAIASTIYKQRKHEIPAVCAYMDKKLAGFVTQLDLSGVPLTSEMMQNIGKRFPKLDRLFLYGCTLDGQSQDSKKLETLLQRFISCETQRIPEIPAFERYKCHIKRALNGSYNTSALKEKDAWGHKLPELLKLLDSLDTRLRAPPEKQLTAAMRALQIVPMEEIPTRILSITVAYLIDPKSQPNAEIETLGFLGACRDLTLFSTKAASFYIIFESARNDRQAPAYQKGSEEYGFQAYIKRLLPPKAVAKPNPAPSALPAAAAATAPAAVPHAKLQDTTLQNLESLDLSQRAAPKQNVHLWVQKFAAQCPLVKHIRLNPECHIDDLLLQSLTHFKLLIEIQVTSPQFDDAAAAKLLPYTNLTHLVIHHVGRLTKMGFQALAKMPQLKSLELLLESNFQEARFLELTASKSLEFLAIQNISPQGAAELQKALPKQVRFQPTYNQVLLANMEIEAKALYDEIALNLQRDRDFFVGPNTLDLRALPAAEATQFHDKLPKLLSAHPRPVVRLRLPPCQLDTRLIETIEKSGVRELNIGLCTSSDLKRLSESSFITAVINTIKYEDSSHLWSPPHEIARRNQFVHEHLFGPNMAATQNVFDAHGIGLLAQMKQLTHLDLGACPAVDDALSATIGQLVNLTTLYLASAPLTAAGLVAMKPLQRLQRFALLSCAKLGDEGVLAITKQFPALEELSLSNNGMTDAIVDQMQRLQKLRMLLLGYQSKLTLAGYKKIAGLKTIERLSLCAPTFDDDLILHYLKKMPKLQILQLHTFQHQKLSEKVLKYAAELKKTVHLVPPFVAAPAPKAAAGSATDSKDI